MSQINVNKIADKTGGGAPEFPYGIQVTGIVTATVANQNVTGNSTFNGDVSVVGVTSAANLDVTGVGTVTDLRLESVSDKITVSTGNSPSLAYNTGGGNVAVVYDATGPITLTVTGVPTSADFNNRALNFSVIVRQGATGYACTSLVVNGTSFSSAYTVGTSTCITYPGGTVATGSTTGYDIFNFVGVNTTGSAADITNYNFLSVKNGDFRLYA